MAQADWTLGVLLGGGSRRMGQDKALLQVGSATLIEHVVTSCKSEQQAVLLAVGQEDRQIPPTLSLFPRLGDRLPDAGPLAGIEAMIGPCQDPWLVVVPCDMPGLTFQDLDRLVRSMGEDDDYGLYKTTSRDQILPLALRRDWVATAVEKTLDRGFRRIVDLFEEGSGRHVPWTDLAGEKVTFHNVNTQGEFQAFLSERRKPC